MVPRQWLLTVLWAERETPAGNTRGDRGDGITWLAEIAEVSYVKAADWSVSWPRTTHTVGEYVWFWFFMRNINLERSYLIFVLYIYIYHLIQQKYHECVFAWIFSKHSWFYRGIKWKVTIFTTTSTLCHGQSVWVLRALIMILGQTALDLIWMTLASSAIHTIHFMYSALTLLQVTSDKFQTAIIIYESSVTELTSCCQKGCDDPR